MVLAYTHRDSTRDDIKMKIYSFGGDLQSIANTIPWHPKTMELWCVSLFRWDPPNQSALVSGVRWSNRNAYGYTPEISGSCWCYIAISLWSISIYIYCFISPIHIYSVNWSLRCVGRTLTSGKWITTMLGFETLRPCKSAQPYLCNMCRSIDQQIVSYHFCEPAVLWEIIS